MYTSCVMNVGEKSTHIIYLPVTQSRLYVNNNYCSRLEKNILC